MKFQSSLFSHQQPDKLGVLITNLGTPKAPTKAALKTYLREFLSDPRVVEMPRVLWQIILNLFILTTRPAKSAAAYQQIWTEQGSPLLEISQQQLDAIQTQISATFGDQVVCELGMRYGQPSIHSALTRLLDTGARKVLVLPLYPQYSATTTASTFDAIAKDFTKRRWLPELRFINRYADHKGYIEACSKQIQRYRPESLEGHKFIFSYHGLPQSYLDKGDPYYCECHKTSRLIAEQTGLSETDYLTCFQSRFGKEPWLQPYTDETLKSLPAQGIKSVSIFCPGFAADCLETLEEIAVENRDYFMQSGGEHYQYIPALNAEAAHIDALCDIISSNISGWTEAIEPAQAILKRANRAQAMGAKR